MMKDGLAIFIPLAAVLGFLVQRRSASLLQSCLRGATVRFVEMMPRMVLAIVAAGFAGKLLPTELVASQIGHDSGFYGIVIATLVGGFTPAGPIVAFPIVVVLMKAGAGFPQVVAFLTAWSVYAFHRMLVYEIPLVGWRFSVMRLAASTLLPFVCAYLTYLAMYVWPIR